MQDYGATRPYALSIAGFDPSGGAGVLADVKTMEALEVYGVSVVTAITVQNDVSFQDVQWVDLALIQGQIALLLERYPVQYVKIGLYRSWSELEQLVVFLRQAYPNLYIVVDPVFRASAGYDFHAQQRPSETLLSAIDLLTPNEDELRLLGETALPHTIAQQLAQDHCAVLYKGGHNTEKRGTDFLYQAASTVPVEYPPEITVQYDKHGSGCVLSAAITARLALGDALTVACQRAKNYTARWLNSNPTRLGYHL